MHNRVVYILFLFFISLSVLGQEQTSEDVRRSMWEQSNAEFNATEIPEKWKDEDAVIIATSEERSYRKPPLSAFLIEENATHSRVKILSKAALSDFGQFSFKKSTYYRGITLETYVGFKIIKPDGREIIIDENEAVAEDLEVSSSTKLTTLKLAIPNLEIGDILDYYTVENYKFPTTKYHSFDPAIFLLREKYPVMYGNIRFAVLRRCYINLKTYNGAPDFTKANDGEEDIYELVYRDQEKVEPTPYLYPYRSLPTIKFKVTYASPTAVQLAPSLLKKSRPGYLNTSVNNQEIGSYLRAYMNNMYGFGNLGKYMKTNFKNVKDKTTLVKEAFYYQRHMLSVQFQESWAIGGNPDYIGFRRSLMLKNLSSYFKKLNIPYSFIVGVPRRIGTVDNLIIEEEVLLGIRTNTNPPIFITSFTTHSLVNELDENFDGAAVLISSDFEGYGALTFEKRKMPQSPDIRNQVLTRNSVDLDLESLMTKISISKTLKGLSRFEEQRILMDAFDFVDEERSKYDLKPLLADLTRKKEEETRRKLREYMQSRDKKLNEKLIKRTKNQLDVDVDTVHTFKILETGRNESSPDFKYEYIAETDELLKKAGPNYLLDIGKLIEKQQEIENEFRESREYDIYMDYPRRYYNEVSLEIPDGYSIQGLDKLNVSVENESGGFKSEAKVEDNTLTLNAVKYYRNSYEPAENWNQILAFLNAADDFNSLKVLIKKN